MNQLPRRQTPMTSENAECHCFGYVEPAQTYFLSKHRSLEPKYPLPLLHLHPALPSPTSKNLSKRSLRKPLLCGPTSPRTTRKDLALNDQGCSKNISELPQPRQNKDISADHSRALFEYDHTSRIKQENFKRTQLPPPTTPPFKSTSCQNIPSFTPFLPSPPPAPTLPRYSPQPLPPMPPLKISFGTPAPFITYSPARSPRERLDEQKSLHGGTLGSYVMPSLGEMKEEVKIKIGAMRTEKGKVARSPDRLERSLNYKLSTTIGGKKQSVQSTAHKENPYRSLHRVDTISLNIQTPNPIPKADAGKSGIAISKAGADPKLSLLGDTNKSKIAVRRLKDHKSGLRKMDDVEEIRSMIDEDEMEEEDKQSVVVGRLKQYGSMVDPSSMSTPTLHSKLISLNTQSSINRSFLRPYEYSYDRLFK